MPCTCCLDGKRTEDVGAGQTGVFVRLALCCSVAAAPALTTMLLIWDSAYVSGTVTSQAMGLHLAHGSTVVPSDLLLSSLTKLTGSLAAGI